MRVLVQVLRTIAGHQSLSALGKALAVALQSVFACECFDLLLIDPETEKVKALFSADSTGTRYLDTPWKIDDGPGGVVWREQIPQIGTIEELNLKYPVFISVLQSLGLNIQSHCALPLTTTHGRIGVLELMSTRANPYVPDEVEFISLIAAQVAIAVEDALNFERLRASEARLAAERDHLRTLLDVTNAVTSKLDVDAIISAVATEIRRIVGVDLVALVAWDAVSQSLCWKHVDFPAGSGLVKLGLTTRVHDSPAYCALSSRRPAVFSHSDLERVSHQCGVVAAMLAEGLDSSCSIPLISRGEVLGVLDVASAGRGTFSESDVALLAELGAEISAAVDNAFAYDNICRLRDKLAEEKLYLEEELHKCCNFDEIVGESSAIRRVLERIEMVAASDSTVLILGETGTGKGLVAQAIHNASPRRNCTLVKLNCSAFPSGLLESELFGHVKGAFTGAVNQRIGRFELASDGTLFLDEVGDIPLELQPKLLRAIQDREFEKLGSSKVIHTNARLIAATNRDLVQMVKDGLFRGDLYYRLNVFPIFIPPLRERREDIPLLVRHFVRKCSQRMNRDIDSISMETIRTLTELPWLGNVRELENTIERAVILSRGSTLSLPLAELEYRSNGNQVEVPALAPTHVSTSQKNNSSDMDYTKDYMRPYEREVILRALRETNGIVSGTKGAARLLGMRRTTLLAKIRRLGIPRNPSTVSGQLQD